jgi:NADH dehydrogenase/NADH:ubiquinone oxidoreductase subunit G
MSTHSAPSQNNEPAAGKRMVKFTANGKELEGEYGKPLLPLLLKAGFRIPTMCHHEVVKPYGACRLCLVEVQKGKKSRLTTSCNYPVLPDIVVTTESERINKHRKVVLELLLARVPNAPKLKALAAEYGVTDTRFDKMDDDCILCGLCERVCREVVEVDALGFMGRGFQKSVGAPFHEASKLCIGCGACVYVCPVDCIKEEHLPTQRTIVRWDRKLPMQTCVKCGYPFAPTYQLLKFQKRTGLDWEFFQVCPDCRETQ